MEENSGLYRKLLLSIYPRWGCNEHELQQTLKTCGLLMASRGFEFSDWAVIPSVIAGAGWLTEAFLLTECICPITRRIGFLHTHSSLSGLSLFVFSYSYQARPPSFSLQHVHWQLWDLEVELDLGSILLLSLTSPLKVPLPQLRRVQPHLKMHTQTDTLSSHPSIIW